MTHQFEDLSMHDRTIHLLAFGHPIALQRLKHIQHTLKFAEATDWSKVIQQPNAEQPMITLVKVLQ